MSAEQLAPWLAPRTGPTAALAVGAMNFGQRTPAAEAKAIIARALERGLRFFDTANVYNRGESERILGQAIRGQRDQVGIATKVGLDRVDGKPEGLGAAAIQRSVDASLQRLQVDQVDVLYLHAPDPNTPIEETLDALAALVAAKRIRHWGISNFAAWQLVDLERLAAARGLPGPALSQVLYNVLVRQVELEYLPCVRRHPLHTTVFNPLAGGVLTGRYAPGAAVPSGARLDNNKLYQRRYGSDLTRERAEALRPVAEAEGMDLVTLAYAWLAHRPGVDSILVGPGSLAHLDAAVDAIPRTISAEGLARIDALHHDYLGTEATYVR